MTAVGGVGGNNAGIIVKKDTTELSGEMEHPFVPPSPPPPPPIKDGLNEVNKIGDSKNGVNILQVQPTTTKRWKNHQVNPHLSGKLTSSSNSRL
jgi:hypothetical protein